MGNTSNLLNNLVIEGEKHQAFRVSLVRNDLPTIITDTGLIKSKIINSRVTDAMFSEILGTVFAHSSDFTDFQRQRRTLNVADVGSVEVFGLADLGCLNIYYERGKSLFEIDLELYFPGQAKKSATAVAPTIEEEKEDEDASSISYSDVFASGGTTADKKLPSADAPPSANEPTRQIDSVSDNSDAEEMFSLNLGGAQSNKPASQLKVAELPDIPPPPGFSDDKEPTRQNSVIADMTEVLKMPSPPAATPPPATEPATPAELTADEELASSPPIAQATTANGFDDLLREMLRLGASDLHVVLDKYQAFRINGIIKQIDNSTAPVRDWLVAAAPKKGGGGGKGMLSGLVHTQVFMYELDSGERFRVSAFKDINGINVAVRSVVQQNCDELNIPVVVRKFCGLSRGLVLLTGGSSSGISSTLTALIELVNSVDKCNLLKIGNPVSEFKHVVREAIVRQVDIGTHVASMDQALVLSQHGDYDALFIDDLEIKNLPALLTCIDRGQLAFAAIHTKVGATALTHLGTMLGNDYSLYTLTRAVVSQVLVPAVDGAFVAAFEVLVIDAAVIKLLQEQKGNMLPAYMEANANKGNITLSSSLVNLVIKGKVSYRSAMAVATDKREFYRTAIKHGIKAAA
ncbi:MAG: hypothetical protein OYH77_02975 [Pseudomonadota bacterium]|nr:hypothetical protein [Pseudomonadota bacterium]